MCVCAGTAMVCGVSCVLVRARAGDQAFVRACVRTCVYVVVCARACAQACVSMPACVRVYVCLLQNMFMAANSVLWGAVGAVGRSFVRGKKTIHIKGNDEYMKITMSIKRNRWI
jgi:hypothetical protein